MPRRGRRRRLSFSHATREYSCCTAARRVHSGQPNPHSRGRENWMRRKLTALALQGGGSHGAYTWGVLDRLLESGAIEIEAVSGASAGAMNAVVLAHGYAVGGREGAREALEAFWTAVSAKMGGIGGSPPALWPDPAKTYLSMTRYFSPYQLNPLNVNPLRDIL